MKYYISVLTYYLDNLHCFFQALLVSRDLWNAHATYLCYWYGRWANLFFTVRGSLSVGNSQKLPIRGRRTGGSFSGHDRRSRSSESTWFFFCQKLHNWPLPTKPVIVLTYSYWRFHFWSWGSDGLRCLSALLVCEQCDCIARWSECWEWWEWLWAPIVIGSRLPTDRHCTRDVLWFGDLRSLCSCRPYLDFV